MNSKRREFVGCTTIQGIVAICNLLLVLKDLDAKSWKIFYFLGQQFLVENLLFVPAGSPLLALCVS